MIRDRVHFHWQNLTDERPGGPTWPYHGRAWLSVGGWTLRLCWDLWTHFCGASISTGDMEDGTTFFVGFPPVALWFGIAAPGAFRSRQQREWSLRVFDWAIWWKVGTDPDGWSSKTPKWRDGNWRPLDALLGRVKFSKREISRHEVSIPMPEGGYPATVVLEDLTWKRPRWFARVGRYAKVDVPAGIPHQGKGENSWDCGEDRLYGTSTQANTVEEAIAAVVCSALRSRRRYDGNVMAKYPAPGGAA